MHLVSGYMLVLDEAPFIVNSVRSLLPHVDELLVMDCGSTDETLRLLAELRLTNQKLQVLSCPQQSGRYSTAWNEPYRRNLCLSLLKHDWFLTIDGDECLEADVDLFRQIEQPALINVVNLLPDGKFLVSHRKDSYFRSYSPDLHIRFANRRDWRYSEELLHCKLIRLDTKEPFGTNVPALIWHYNAAYKPLGLLYQHAFGEFVTEAYNAVAPYPIPTWSTPELSK